MNAIKVKTKTVRVGEECRNEWRRMTIDLSNGMLIRQILLPEIKVRDMTDLLK